MILLRTAHLRTRDLAPGLEAVTHTSRLCVTEYINSISCPALFDPCYAIGVEILS